MPDYCQAHERHDSGKRSVAPWLTLAAAVGIGAAAFLLAKRMVPRGGEGADDLIDLCERAASALDARSSQWSMAG